MEMVQRGRIDSALIIQILQFHSRIAQLHVSLPFTQRRYDMMELLKPILIAREYKKNTEQPLREMRRCDEIVLYSQSDEDRLMTVVVSAPPNISTPLQSSKGGKRERNLLSIKLLRISRKSSRSPLTFTSHLNLQINPLDPILLQPSQAQFQQPTSRPHRVLHLLPHSFWDSWNHFGAGLSVGCGVWGAVDNRPGERRGREGGTQLDVAEVGREGVESVEDVCRVEDSRSSCFALFDEEGE